MKKRKEKEIEWSQTWLAIRQDRPESKFDADMSIMDAFNNLSNDQLRSWIHHRMETYFEMKINNIIY